MVISRILVPGLSGKFMLDHSMLSGPIGSRHKDMSNMHKTRQNTEMSYSSLLVITGQGLPRNREVQETCVERCMEAWPSCTRPTLPPDFTSCFGFSIVTETS